jgi:hypothetical protein
MQGWQTPYLGLRDLPREITDFELQSFFSFGQAELELISRRRGDNHKLGLALHIGFVRMSGRPLNSVRAVPPVLLRHLGQMLGITTPDLASLRALYARGRTLFDHQQQACEALGFAWMTEHQRRALVRVLRDEVTHSADRERLLLHARHWLYEHRLLIVHDRVIRSLVAVALTELEAATAQAIRAAVPARPAQTLGVGAGQCAPGWPAQPELAVERTGQALDAPDHRGARTHCLPDGFGHRSTLG